jgi:hypothetical protein
MEMEMGGWVECSDVCVLIDISAGTGVYRWWWSRLDVVSRRDVPQISQCAHDLHNVQL